MVVSTEFGRKPEVNANNGRDHHPEGFTCLMAGAGVKAGQIYGATTKDGKKAETDAIDVTDFNATIAWRMGIDPDLEEKSPLQPAQRPPHPSHQQNAKCSCLRYFQDIVSGASVL